MLPALLGRASACAFTTTEASLVGFEPTNRLAIWVGVTTTNRLAGLMVATPAALPIGLVHHPYATD